jgi:hypothetical protein
MDEIFELLKGYYCLFRGNPYKCTPYAILATKERAMSMIFKSGGLSGPLTFEEWLDEFEPQANPGGKPPWKDQ